MHNSKRQRENDNYSWLPKNQIIVRTQDMTDYSRDVSTARARSISAWLQRSWGTIIGDLGKQVHSRVDS